MSPKKADIIARLEQDILSLQGFKRTSNGTAVDVGLGPIQDCFPNGSFPVGAVHEFLCSETEDTSATGGFIVSIISTLMKSGGVTLWISSSRKLFPPALTSFGIQPDKIVFVDLSNPTDILWIMEEALRCGGLAAVVGEIQEINFRTSRRFQLAVEQSGVTGFILRCSPRNLNTIACVSRWKIKSLPSELDDHMPGVGFPRWNVELLKMRNGRPGIWQMEWSAGRFRHISPLVASIPQEQIRKTG